jgi:hypothetical protein
MLTFLGILLDNLQSNHTLLSKKTGTDGSVKLTSVGRLSTSSAQSKQTPIAAVLPTAVGKKLLANNLPKVTTRKKSQQILSEREKYEDFLRNHPFNNRKSNNDIEEDEAREEREKNPDRPDLAFEQDFLRTMDPSLKRPTPELLADVVRRNRQQWEAEELAPTVPGSGASTAWKERGPRNVGGRVRAIAWDPNDVTGKKIWAGGVSGGLWYNNNITDSAVSWIPVSDFWNSLSITTIVFDPINPQNMYVATGEGYQVGATIGAGIWKSTNGGNTWSQLSATQNFVYINDLIMRKEGGSSVLYAAVDGNNYKGTWFGTALAGLHRSTDGGTTWNQVLPPISYSNPSYPFVASSLAIGKDNRIWVGTKASPFGLTDRGGGRVLYSDNGTTWVRNDSSAVVNGNGRVTVATAPSSANYVYSFTESASKVSALRKTIDGGISWSNLASKPDDIDNGIPADDFTRGQAWYDQALAVDPEDSSVVMIGGINLFRTIDGGVNWKHISKWSNNAQLNTLTCSYVHADQHIILFKPNDPSKVLFGCDGGIFYSSNIYSATTRDVIEARNKDFNVTQYYAGAIHPGADSNYYLAGSQDNGTQKFAQPNKSYTTQASGGDGAYCFIDQTDPKYQISSYVYNSFYRSSNYGATFTTLLNDGNTGSFINPACYDNNQHILYTYKSSNKSSGGVLYAIKNINSTPKTDTLFIPELTSAVTAFKVSPYTTNSTTLYIGTSSGLILKVTNANGAGVATNITSSLPIGSISCIEIGKNENELLVTFFNYGMSKIWYTSDGGNKWVDKMGDFPNIPARWALFNPNKRSTEVILATELGIYATTNFNAASPIWSASNNGFSNVRTDMLQMRNSDYQVIAATHGRGLFSSNGFAEAAAPSMSGFSPTSAVAGTTITIVGANFTNASAVSFGGVIATSFTVVNDNRITAVVASGNSGSVKVNTGGGEAKLDGFTYIPSPVINSFTPSSAGRGVTVLIKGVNLSAVNAVSFGDSAVASFTILSDTSINAIIGNGATGKVKVTSPAGVATANGFIYCTSPTISTTATIFCVGNSQSLTTSAEGTYQWYKDGSPISGTTATAQTYAATTAGLFTLKLTDGAGCAAFSNGITLTTNPTPLAPTTSAINYCIGGTAVALSATATAGNIVKWYSAATGGNGVATAPTPVTTTAGATDYFVSQTTAAGCESPRAKITVTVGSNPTAPIALPINYCAGSSALALTATATVGNSLMWYTAATGGTGSSTAPIPTTSTVGSSDYFVSQLAGAGCESPRAKITVTIEPTPAKPTITKDAAGNLVSSAATGNQWYLAGVAITNATAATYKPITSGNYTLKSTTGNCASALSDIFNYVVTAVSNLSIDQYVKLFPNPSRTSLVIQYKLGNMTQVSVIIIDAKGKIVLQQKNLQNGTALNLMNLASGTYFVKLVDKNGVMLYLDRILKQ